MDNCIWLNAENNIHVLPDTNNILPDMENQPSESLSG
jgi:hypothetical protein